MIIPTEAQFEIRLRFGCGCVERWALLFDPARSHEEVERIAAGPCIPATCSDCAAHRAADDHERAYCPQGRHHAALEAAAALTNRVAAP